MQVSATLILILVVFAALVCGAILLSLVFAIQVTTIRHRSAGELRCPACGVRDVRPSMQRGIWDRLYDRFGCHPYRCRMCGVRFLRYVAE